MNIWFWDTIKIKNIVPWGPGLQTTKARAWRLGDREPASVSSSQAGPDYRDGEMILSYHSLNQNKFMWDPSMQILERQV